MCLCGKPLFQSASAAYAQRAAQEVADEYGNVSIVCSAVSNYTGCELEVPCKTPWHVETESNRVHDVESCFKVGPNEDQNAHRTRKVPRRQAGK